MNMRASNYELRPFVEVPSRHVSECRAGWDAVTGRLAESVREQEKRKPRVILAVECYAGVWDNDVRERLAGALQPTLVVDAKTAFLPPEAIDRLVEPDLGGDDPIFGFLTRRTMEDFLDPDRVQAVAEAVRQVSAGIVLVAGPGASLLAEPDILVYADMPRWEGQLRQRRGEADNLGTRNRGLKASLQYKRSFFVDWRVCDRLKRNTMDRWDFLLDTTRHESPKLISGEAHTAVLRHVVTRPFRVVPFFDPGPWGGRWMRRVLGLPDGPPNYAWGFDCVPEENSLLLDFGGELVEIPSLNLVFAQPAPLLGEAVYGRFGAEFPIRFDFLDTIGGGNLSFQVHPLVDYARDQFGLSYTQDESYYILDAEPGAQVFLGCKKGVRPEEMIADLRDAQDGKKTFDDERFAARFPAGRHDHFLIPAGTLHCSGAGAMVLEISATPYIFTFKLWDWNRLGLDGTPRPVNIERGRRVIRWDRDEDYAREHLVNRFEEIASGDGWTEERTGLHEAQFIETRRHWFTSAVTHARSGSVEVLNLVEGRAAVVESLSGGFEPFEIHYAETFIVPDAAGDYRIRPAFPGERCATVKAFVRTKAP